MPALFISRAVQIAMSLFIWQLFTASASTNVEEISHSNTNPNPN